MMDVDAVRFPVKFGGETSPASIQFAY